MKNDKTNLGQVTIEAAIFNRVQRLKKAKAALERRVRQLMEEYHFPKVEDFSEDGVGVIVDGNGTPIGKFSVYTVPPKVIDETRILRIS